MSQYGRPTGQKEKRKERASEEAKTPGLKTKVKDEVERSTEDKDKARATSVKRVLQFLRPRRPA